MKMKRKYWWNWEMSAVLKNFFGETSMICGTTVPCHFDKRTPYRLMITPLAPLFQKNEFLQLHAEAAVHMSSVGDSGFSQS
jgi:hypothetical protein